MGEPAGCMHLRGAREGGFAAISWKNAVPLTEPGRLGRRGEEKALVVFCQEEVLSGSHRGRESVPEERRLGLR